MGHGHHDQRVPRWSRRRSPRRVTGSTRSERSSSASSAASSWCSASTSSNTSESMIPIGAVAVHGMCRNLGNVGRRPVRHRPVRRRRPVLGRRYRTAVGPDLGQRRRRRHRLRRRPWASCTAARKPTSSESPKKVNGKASTSTSTVHPPTIRKRPTWERGSDHAGTHHRGHQAAHGRRRPRRH